jgi:hypothetical protein
MATWSDQLFQTLEGEQAIEGRYSDKAKERTFHHGPNCPGSSHGGRIYARSPSLFTQLELPWQAGWVHICSP